METVLEIVFLVTSLSLFIAIVWIWRGSAKKSNEISELKIELARVSQLEASLDDAIDRLAEETAARQEAVLKYERSESAIAERERAIQQERENTEKLAKELQEKFKILASETLQTATKSFLENAEVSFKNEQKKAEQSLKHTVEPLTKNLDALKKQIEQVEKARAEDKGKIDVALDQLGQGLSAQTKETAKLVNALQRSPTARGRWGEDALKNIFDISGLTEGIDYSSQQNTTSAEGDPLIPDYVVRLPGGGSFIIDSKVAISAYLDAIETDDPQEKKELFRKHARQLRNHVKQLAKKEYAKAVKGAVDFVALFVPSESFFSAAIEHDNDLFDEALKQSIIVVTPATLLALTKAVSYGWRQRALEESAVKIADVGRELHERLKVFLSHMGTTGRGLKTATSNYNKAVASLEGRVLVSARKMAELNAPSEVSKLEAPEQVEDSPRMLANESDPAPAVSGPDGS